MGGATTPRRSRVVSRVVVASALLACLSLLVSACGGSKPASAPGVNTLPSASPNASAAPSVSVTGLPDSIHVDVSGGQPGTSPGSGLDFVSPIYTLGPAGPLGATATVTIELDHAVPAGTTLVTATRGSSTDAWSWLPATLQKDLRHAQFTTTHFSQFGVLTVDAAAALATFRQTVHSALVSTVEPGAEKPVCDNPKGARAGGWKAASWPRKTLAWCLGLDKGKHVLKVVNRRAVPVQVAHGSAATTSATSKISPAWTTWLGLLGPGSGATFLAPGGSATYDAEITPGSTLVISTAADAKARSTRALYAAVSAIVELLGAYGSTVPSADQAFAVLVARPQCADALGQDSNTLVAGCLTVPRLRRVLGDGASLLGPVLTAPSTKKFWAKQFTFLADQEQSTDLQHIGISRGSGNFGALVGTFTGHTRFLTVSKTGLVTERLDDGVNPVIQLTYQLSDPKLPSKKNGSTTATSVLTKVKVYDRKAISGNPPKVGDAGTITLDNGIVTPPYLQTTYCDSATAANGDCGA